MSNTFRDIKEQQQKAFMESPLGKLVIKALSEEAYDFEDDYDDSLDDASLDCSDAQDEQIYIEHEEDDESTLDIESLEGYPSQYLEDNYDDSLDDASLDCSDAQDEQIYIEYEEDDESTLDTESLEEYPSQYLFDSNCVEFGDEELDKTLDVETLDGRELSDLSDYEDHVIDKFNDNNEEFHKNYELTSYDSSIEEKSLKENEETLKKSRSDKSDTPDVKEPSPIQNKIDGLAREEDVEKELKEKYPESEGYKIHREVYLRDKDGKIVKDPETGEARRIDFVVEKDGKIIDSIEVTSKTADKKSQIAKEKRIRENGGNYIKDRDGNLIEIPSEVQTRIERRD